MTVQLTEENFLLYAAKNYNNPSCTGMKEFEDDLKRFKYIKRLLRRYKKSGVLSDKLLLNHIILLHNVFLDATAPMLFYKLEETFWPQIKTFLVFLNYLPDHYHIGNSVDETEIPMDPTIITHLRKL